MTIDQVIALGASIGACLSAIAAFVVTYQMSVQRKEVYKPQLVLVTTSFEAKLFSDESLPHLVNKLGTSTENNGFVIPLQNVGMGAAKDLQILWNFPIEELVSKINEITQAQFEQVFFKYENETLALNSPVYLNFISFWKSQKKSTKDFVLPATINNSVAYLEIPNAYISILSALVHFSAKSQGERDLILGKQIYAGIKVEILYHDIGENEHEVAFEIIPELCMLQGDGKEFHGYFKIRKII